MSETLAGSPEVAVGTELPPFRRDSGFAYWNRYAAVNDEFIPIHMDDEAGQAAGYPTAFGMGNLTWSYMHIAVHEWFGDACHIAKLSTQFRSAVTRGTQVVVKGTVNDVRTDGATTIIEVDIRAENGDGGVLAPATATVEIAP